jgi:hypothetical protein
MPTLQIQVNLRILGSQWMAKMGQRVSDFTQVWDRIVDSFTEHDVDKFERGKGAELTGVEFADAGVSWDPITETYAKRKRREITGPGSEDWRMVGTGATMESLTNRGDSNWFEKIDPLSAVFGSVDPTVLWNWERSPVTFLDEFDKQAISLEFFHYLNGDDPYDPYPQDVIDQQAVATMGDA